MSFLSTLSAEAASIRQTLRQRVLDMAQNPTLAGPFDSLALAIFRYQATYNPVYRAYVRHLNVRPESVTDLHRIPFMPIGFFKKHRILTGFNPTDAVPTDVLTFVSSGTTGLNTGDTYTSERTHHFEQNSCHLVPDPDLYNAVSTQIFEQTYGPLSNVHILALLPSYLERNNSSLVYMIRQFMDQSGSPLSEDSGKGANTNQSGFFLRDYDALTERLRRLSAARIAGSSQRILLIGVTFALLDWAESAPDLSFLAQNPNLIVMETGGMKGRRKELLREEVHELLRAQLGVETIHSEYGMTELLSQAYSVGNGVFRPGPTLRVFLRDINDPFTIYPNDLPRTGERRTGGINVVDLANLDSCSFIETQDLGRYVGEEGSFNIIGRFDNSDVRGCNLMVL